MRENPSPSSSSSASRSKSREKEVTVRTEMVRKDDDELEILEVHAPPDSELQLVMGDEPVDEPQVGKEIPPLLAKHCSSVLKEGLKEADRDALLKKYLPPKNLPTVRAPELNPEVEAMLKKDHQAALKRDGYQQQSQAQLGACISALCFALTPIADRSAEEERKDLLTCLADSAKL